MVASRDGKRLVWGQQHQQPQQQCHAFSSDKRKIQFTPTLDPPRTTQERLLSVVQERTPALPRQTMEDFLATPPPWEVLCGACGANADPEAKIKKTPIKKGKGSKKAAAAAAAAAAAEEEVWPALRCFICRRPRHVECLLLPGQARVSKRANHRSVVVLHVGVVLFGGKGIQIAPGCS